MKLLLIVFILSFQALLSQEYIRGEISYKKHLDYSKSKDKLKGNPKALNLLDQVKKEGELVQYNLVFNNEESEYSSIKKVKNDYNKNKFNLNLGTFRGRFYFNKSSSEGIHEKTFLGEKMRIVIKPINNWKLTTDRKKIGKYNCLKAEYKYTFKRYDDKEVSRTIVAWYTPEIPFSYGPERYNSLPGLILEVIDGSTITRAENILIKKSDSKKTQINKPTKGRLIKKEKLEELSGKEIQSRMAKIKSK